MPEIPQYRTECCGVLFAQPCKSWCVNAPAYDPHPRLDRWLEALYGARLRFHAEPSANANVPPGYWPTIYTRWCQLYRREDA